VVEPFEALLDKTMNDQLSNRELVSALADGQLRGRDFERAVELASGDADAQAAWQTYHLTGDVLRSSDIACRTSDDAFMARLKASLAQETVYSKPAVMMSPVAEAGPVAARHAEAANESGFRWKLVAGFASLAAVAAIGWNAAGSLGKADLQPQMAKAPAPAIVAQPAAVSADAVAQQVQQPVNVAGTQQVMIRDPRLDELLSAHRQFGGTSALQMPAGFLRNATFEGPAR